MKDHKKTVLHIVLDRLRKKHKLSIGKLAKESGICKTTLQYWHYGVSPQDNGKVLTLAQYFKVSLEYLLFGVEKDQEMAIDIERLRFINESARLQMKNQLSLFDNDKPEEIRKTMELTLKTLEGNC